LEGCRWPWATVVGILVGLVVVGVVSWVLLEGVLPGFVVWGVPFAVCGVVGGLRASVEAVRLLGGVEVFFCGGRRVLHALLRGEVLDPPGRIVSWGVYGVARHPVYSATLGAYMLLAAAFPRLLLGVVLVGVWVWLAARVEERFVAASIGSMRRGSPVWPRCALCCTGVVLHVPSPIMGRAPRVPGAGWIVWPGTCMVVWRVAVGGW